MRQRHDRGAEPLLVDAVDRGVNARKAVDTAQESGRKFLQPIADVRHIGHADRSIAVFRMRKRHQRRVLVIIVVAAEPIPVPIGLHRLETGAAERFELAVFIGHLRTADLQRNALSDAGDHIIQQFGVRIDLLRDHVVQVVGCLIRHRIKIGIATHLFHRTQGADFTLPQERDGQDQNKDQQQQDFDELLHIA